MNKYKVGQRVKIIRTGKNGSIRYIDNPDFSDNGRSSVCYLVDYEDFTEWFTVHDIELIQEILDEKEKEYLSNIVKPFRDKVENIKKLSAKQEYEFIVINMKKENDLYFPDFKKGAMYKGMEEEKKYTLEELGI